MSKPEPPKPEPPKPVPAKPVSIDPKTKKVIDPNDDVIRDMDRFTIDVVTGKRTKVKRK